MRDVIHCLRGTDFCPSHPFRGTIWGQNYEKNMKTGRKYGEKEKMQILIKSLIFRTLQIYIFSFYAFLFFVSLALRRYLTFFNGIWSSVMLYREYPEKSFKSFSLLANALPVGIPAEGLGSGILQLGVECFSRTDLPPILRESFFLKDIFRLKHFTMHILQPECRRAGRLRAG